MEVKPGFKQTEIGVLPYDWEVRKLSEHFRIYAGGDVPKHSLSLIQSVSHPYPIFANALQDRGLYGYTNERRSKNDSLTITARGYLGHAEYRDEPFFPIVRLLVLEPTGQLDARFTTYAVNDRVEFAIESTGVPQLTAPQVGKYSVAAPPTLPEQRTIATALSDVDALLGGLDRLIAKKGDLKQAAMQQLLTGQTRLPGFSGKWEVKPLTDFVKQDRFAIVDGPFGSQLRVHEYVESGVPVIEMEHLCDKFITERIERCITPRKFEDLKRSAVYPGDIIISKTGSLGKLGLIPEGVERGLITSRLAKITLDPSRADRFFVFQYLLKLRNEGYWETVSQGGTMQILGIGMLQNAPMPTIALSEQAAIAAVLSDMDAELSALESRRDKTRALKQGMMQELLTGRTRLL